MGGSLSFFYILIAGVAVSLGLFLLLSHGRDRQRLLFALLNLSAAAWIIFSYFGNSDHYYFVVADYITGTFLGLLFWLFSREIKRTSLRRERSSEKNGKVLRVIPYIVVALVVCMILAGQVVSVEIHPLTAARSLTDGSAYIIYPLTILVLASISLYNLVSGYVRSRDAVQKTRVRLVLIGLLVAFIGIAVPNLILQNVLPKDSTVLSVLYGGSYVGILFFLALSTYAIARHGLFDVKLAAIRSAAYASSLVTLAAIYYALAYGASTLVWGEHTTTAVSVSPVNIALALILAFLFQPIRQFFDKLTNDVFYRNKYDTDTFFAELNQLLVSTTDLRGLLTRAARQLATTFKAEQVFFYIHSPDTHSHLSAGTKDHAHLPLYDVTMLDNYVRANGGGMIVSEELKDGNTVRRMLISHRITLVLPLRQGDAITGYVLLGDHLTGTYTKRDIGVLSTISAELVIAIQNAMSLHELKELNATLQQRIDVATKELRSSNAQLKHLDEVKDEFISMASHQLRTPLTSVKGYISMMLDGDVGKLTPQQEKVLLEAFNSSERMVRLISDFLNVSRLQTGKFMIDKSDINMARLVEQEVANLQIMAKSRNMLLELQVSDGELWLHADEAKLREVVMNFIDNAIYYSRAESTIKISLKKHGDMLEFTVRDKGIGVPEADQARLFHKFFRASNARRQRPDGTGVGLYLARRVISAHGGKMIFASTEGRGSTFGFSLPLIKRSDR